MPRNDGRPGEESRAAANDHRIADEITADSSRSVRSSLTRALDHLDDAYSRACWVAPARPVVPEVVTVTTEPTIDPLDHNDTEPATMVRPVMRLWRAAKAASKRDSEARRARVLAHEDLAQRLVAPPLRLSAPARWSGWIPPRLLAEESCAHCGASGDRRCRDRSHRARVNDSPNRRQLVEISVEAMARESGR